MQFLQMSRSSLAHACVPLACIASILIGAIHCAVGQPYPLWPPAISQEASTVWLGEPKLESWDYLRVRIKAPVQHKMGETQTLTGTVTLEAQTFANRASQDLVLRNFHVLDLKLNGASPAQIVERTAAIDALLRDLRSRTELGSFVDAFADEKKLPSIDIADNVPKIFVSHRPGAILQFDGPPMWLPLEDSKLSFAVNTNWDIFYDNKSTFYYLLAGDIWLATHDPFSNEWVMPKSLPKEMKHIPHNPDFANVWKHLPYEANPDLVPPAVFYSESAAELILIDGDPKLEPIGDSGLAVVTNSQSDLFLYRPTGEYYFLVAGRWFKTADLGGFWRNVDSLPEAFAAIPESHPKGHVLVHVPGTSQSKREALWSLVPQLATIQRNGAKVIVEFAGKPKFVPIDGTSLLWVPNATVPIIAQGQDLFACHQGVWFHSISTKGPWEVASSLPPDIYKIPSRSPAFHLSFVRLVASDETTVTFGYTGGYENLFVHDGLVVYGTGFSHPPALQYGAYTYPVYFAQPATYGAGAWYDPKNHVFLRGRPGYGPFGGFGATCRFNSVTSHYFRAQTLYGDDLGEKPSLAFLPYTAAYGKLASTYNPYASWGDVVVERQQRSARGATAAQKEPAITIQVGQPVVSAPDAPLPQSETGFQPKSPR